MRLDPALHHPTRVTIVTRLMTTDRMRFTALREACGLTSGNLASHLDALEKAGYVEQKDAIIALKPGKLVAMTPRGRDAFGAYVDTLEALLAQMRMARAGNELR